MSRTKSDLEAKIESLEDELASAEAEIASEGESVKYRPSAEIRANIRYFKKELDKLNSVDRGRHRAYRVRGDRGL